MPDASTPDAHHVPEKPTVDGLEARWTARWDDEGTYRFNRSRARARASTASTRRRPRSRASCTSATSSATPKATWSRAFGACAARTSSIPWAGTTTACRPSGASRTSTACAVTRPSPTTPTSSPPRSPRQGEGLDLAAELRRALPRAAPRSTRRPSSTLWRYLGVSVDWSLEYTTISPAAQAVSQRGFLADARARRGLLRRGADALGHRLSHRRLPGRARGPRTARHLPPRRLRPRRRHGHGRDRDDATGDARRAASRSSPTPTTRATSELVRHRPSSRRSSGSRCRSSPTSWPTPTRARASR